ncbi:hypothetical protein FQN50_000965 [Emmonsiellopsis sp. PD_5]|nr:hypothetical protein FQN50_000965 [Emmonsiellopsis sp. PD_5]
MPILATNQGTDITHAESRDNTMGLRRELGTLHVSPPLGKGGWGKEVSRNPDTIEESVEFLSSQLEDLKTQSCGYGEMGGASIGLGLEQTCHPRLPKQVKRHANSIPAEYFKYRMKLAESRMIRLRKQRNYARMMYRHEKPKNRGQFRCFQGFSGVQDKNIEAQREFDQNGKENALNDPICPVAQKCSTTGASHEDGTFLPNNVLNASREIHVRALLLRTSVAIDSSRLDKADDLIIEAFDVAQKLKSLPIEALCRFWEAMLRHHQGRHKEAAKAIVLARPCVGKYIEGEEVRFWEEHYRDLIAQLSDDDGWDPAGNGGGLIEKTDSGPSSSSVSRHSTSTPESYSTDDSQSPEPICGRSQGEGNSRRVGVYSGIPWMVRNSSSRAREALSLIESDLDSEGSWCDASLNGEEDGS